jgi:hypothetical protein
VMTVMFGQDQVETCDWCGGAGAVLEDEKTGADR